MKIGILTFHSADNYGAVLQAYGLQEYLINHGHNVYIIDYRPKYLLKPYKIFNFRWDLTLSIFQNIYFVIRAIWVLPIRWKRKRNFTLFAKKYLNLYPTKNLTNRNANFDAFIFGSDQIWNPQITEGLDKIYFGQFQAAEGKKLIAYAASAGNVSDLISPKKRFASYLLSYTAISVREKSLADFVNSQKWTQQVKVVLDPVLLTGRETFEKIASQKKKEKNYLLLFQFGYNDTITVRKMAEAIAKKQRLEIVELVPDSESLRDKRIITTASLEYFIALFRDASHIVTTSYHGTAFSLLFEKDFHVINTSNSERMVNLLSALGLQDRLINNETDIISGKIDYEQVNNLLKKIRLASESFLDYALHKKE